MLTPIHVSVSIDAVPSAVFAFVSDPYLLPQWAPGFAERVRADGEHWVVTNAEGDKRVRVRIDTNARTVDFLHPHIERGAFSRVVANGNGSEFIFVDYLPLAATTQEHATRQREISEELAAVRQLLEQSRPSAPAHSALGGSPAPRSGAPSR